MATDYDAPRKTEEDLSEDSLEALKARRTEKPSAVVDEDAARWREALSADGFDPAQALVVRLASEGLAMNMGTPYATEQERELAHARLLELAEPR